VTAAITRFRVAASIPKPSSVAPGITSLICEFRTFGGSTAVTANIPIACRPLARSVARYSMYVGALL
jgi:hypothetical protein